MQLEKPICVDAGQKVAIFKNVLNRWILVAKSVINGGKTGYVDNDKFVLNYKSEIWEREVRLPNSFFGFESSEYTKESIIKLTSECIKFKSNVIVGVESRGFVFGSPIAFDLDVPFVMARKPGKLPNETYKRDFDLEYGSTSLEIQKNTDLVPEDNVVIIDDLIATGGTAEAAAKLVEMSDAKVAAFVFAINLFDLSGSDNLVKKGYKVENLMDFPGH